MSPPKNHLSYSMDQLSIPMGNRHPWLPSVPKVHPWLDGFRAAHARAAQGGSTAQWSSEGEKKWGENRRCWCRKHGKTRDNTILWYTFMVYCQCVPFSNLPLWGGIPSFWTSPMFQHLEDDFPLKWAGLMLVGDGHSPIWLPILSLQIV